MLFSDGRTDAPIALSLFKGVEKRKVRAAGNREEKKTEHLVGRNGILKRHQVGEDEKCFAGGSRGENRFISSSPNHQHQHRHQQAFVCDLVAVLSPVISPCHLSTNPSFPFILSTES